MCCGCEKKKLSCWGMIIALAFLGGAIACIILAGINFNLLFTGFSAGGWKTLAALQLAAIIFVIFIGILAFCTFWCDYWCMTVTVRNLLISSLSFYFSFLLFLHLQ
jgi:hypothetical protein